MKCPVFGRCGGCSAGLDNYEKALQIKYESVKKLLSPLVKVEGVLRPEDPYHYRTKVHRSVGRVKGKLALGVYEEGTHRLVPVIDCGIEDKDAIKVLAVVEKLANDFKLEPYNEDTGRGFLRHILIRKSLSTGQVLLTLVTGAGPFPGSRNFVRAIIDKCPFVTSVVRNINTRKTSFLLGQKEEVLFGRGFITERMGGVDFRLSSASFFQVNPPMAKKLFDAGFEMLDLKGTERLIDAYCGTGVLGLLAAPHVKSVLGVESNASAVQDAKTAAKKMGYDHVKFMKDDAGAFLIKEAETGEPFDVLIMDPPREGSSREFLDAAALAKPKKILYISCEPTALKRDLKYLLPKGYKAEKAVCADFFPFTNHIESAVLLSRTES